MAGGVRPRRRGLVALAAAAGLLAAGWLAPAPWLAEHWPRVLAAALVLVVFVVLLQNDGRIGVLQAVAGVAVVAAVVATWQRLDADLAGAHLEQALLCGAQLQGADLAGAHLAGARVNGATRWPSGFDWRAAGARPVPVCLA